MEHLQPQTSSSATPAGAVENHVGWSDSSTVKEQQQPQPLQPPTNTSTTTTPTVNVTSTETTRQQRQRRPRGVLAFIDDSHPLTLYPYSSDHWKNNSSSSSSTETSITTNTRHSGLQSKRQRRRQMRRLQEQLQGDEESSTENLTRQPTTKCLMSLETIIHDCQVVVLFLFDPQQAYSKKVRDGLVPVISSSLDNANNDNTSTINNDCSSNSSINSSIDNITAASAVVASALSTTTAATSSIKGRKIVCLAMAAPGSAVVVMMPVTSRSTTTTTRNEDNEDSTTTIAVELEIESTLLPSSSVASAAVSSPMVDDFLKDSGFFLSTYTSNLALVLQSTLNKVPSLAVIPTSTGRNVAATHEELALEWNNDTNTNITQQHSNDDVDNTDPATAGNDSSSSSAGSGDGNAVAQAWLSGKSALGTVQQITAHILFPSCTIQ